MCSLIDCTSKIISTILIIINFYPFILINNYFVIIIINFLLGPALIAKNIDVTKQNEVDKIMLEVSLIFYPANTALHILSTIYVYAPPPFSLSL